MGSLAALPRVNCRWWLQTETGPVGDSGAEQQRHQGDVLASSAELLLPVSPTPSGPSWGLLVPLDTPGSRSTQQGPFLH